MEPIAYDSINIRIADECETLANASKSEAALEEKILDGTRNCIAVSGDGTWKTRGHTTLVGVCTLIGVVWEGARYRDYVILL
ncbi:hypothetical protein TNCV_1878491 [Trichonephila clavipes]|nr:hypothetical protein TNCV_1878491 [Trichonephila clavipes]